MAAAKYLTLISGIKSLVSSLDSSAGAGDAGKIVALDAAGKIANNMMPTGIGADSATLTASETLTAGDIINIWNDAGTPSMRKADSATTGKEADGFVIAGVTAAATGDAILDGTISGLSALTIGAKYFISTSGGITTTAPSTVGHTIQYVGKAKSATELIFEQGEVYEIVS